MCFEIHVLQLRLYNKFLDNPNFYIFRVKNLNSNFVKNFVFNIQKKLIGLRYLGKISLIGVVKLNRKGLGMLR